MCNGLDLDTTNSYIRDSVRPPTGAPPPRLLMSGRTEVIHDAKLTTQGDNARRLSVAAGSIRRCGAMHLSQHLHTLEPCQLAAVRRRASQRKGPFAFNVVDSFADHSRASFDTV
eukprot:7381952-Prymnesium_polylepis.1